jgi:hypothetical protein
MELLGVSALATAGWLLAALRAWLLSESKVSKAQNWEQSLAVIEQILTLWDEWVSYPTLY